MVHTRSIDRNGADGIVDRRGRRRSAWWDDGDERRTEGQLRLVGTRGRWLDRRRATAG